MSLLVKPMLAADKLNAPLQLKPAYAHSQVLRVSDDLVKPFQLGLSVFGAMAFFLAGLIRTSLPYFYWERRPSSPDRAERR